MPKSPKESTGSDNQYARSIKDSTHQIWLAGLGAFSKAQKEGGKLFERLVEEGEAVQDRTRQASKREDDDARATDASPRTWDKLEQVFEDRVARALKRLGIPTHDDVDNLSRRIDALAANVQILVERGQTKKPAGPGSAATDPGDAAVETPPS